LIGYSTLMILLIEYMALLRGYGALLIGYSTLMILWIEYMALMRG